MQVTELISSKLSSVSVSMIVVVDVDELVPWSSAAFSVEDTPRKEKRKISY